ncbi:acyl carrier protein [Marinicella sp. W31]|uniref:acyl carrier protein n=1 Tax=Marinicella sp. W31 TaxID=3023713 RepID=UPI0037568D65
MNKQEITDSVKSVLATIINDESVKEMDLGTSLKDDLGIDSMTSLTFLMALEDEIDGFAVDVDTLEAEYFESIGTICDYVSLQVNGE